MRSKQWHELSRRSISRRSLLDLSARASLGAAGIALVGCGDDDDDEAPAPAEQATGLPPRPSRTSEGDILPDTIVAEGDYKVAIAYPVFDVPFFVRGVHFGAVQECERLGVECVFTFGGGYDKPEAQVNDMEDLIAQGVDGIILTAAVDAALIPVMDKANEAGIIVTSFSINSESETFYGYEGISHFDSARGFTELLGQCLSERGVENPKIIAVGGPKGAAWYDPRKEALDEIAPNLGLEVVAHQYTSSAREETIRVFEDLLTANPDVDGVWTGSADMAMGVITVLKNRGFAPGEVCVASGAELSVEYADAIREGWYFGNVTQQAVLTGQQAIRKLVAHLNGDSSVPFYLREPFAIVTQDNLDTVDRSTFLGPEDFDPPSRVAPRS